MSDAQKERYLLELGVGRVVFQQFTPEFAALSPKDFIQTILIDQLRATDVVVGPNFAFGADAAGNIQTLLKNVHFKTHVIEPVKINDEVCSSSLIREAILKGDLAKAKLFLGRDYSLTGQVVQGAGRGKKLGFPTANLQVEQEILPPLGVYASYSKIVGRAVTNIGRQPTFGAQNPIRVETYFLDFSGLLYAQELEIFLTRKIRDEKKFDSVEDLKKQIREDIAQI